MGMHPVFVLSILLAVVAGTAAGLLALLTAKSLQHSPFGRTVLGLSLVLSLFTLYHITLLVLPDQPIIVESLKTGTYTGVAAFVLLMVQRERDVLSGTTPPNQ